MNHGEDADIIRQLEEARCAAMLAGDAATLRDLFEEGLVYIHSTGARDSRESYLDKLTSGAMRYEAVKFDLSEIQTGERFALVCGSMTASVRIASGTIAVASQYEAVWMRTNGTWRLGVIQGFHSEAGAGRR
ncbi:nuclear transport factor 2 family protein [Paraburkholderia sp. UCT31]|uniref:nuclear transport factor 2 family protein n=1 Tax=Paraburkholderia sp. UCT31 TaxID=2615209 RepID=UPI001655D7D0|nr:nuclear transport factor 2 family protein [Paraburkholderia sp. UCT31]MBC8741115.1 nuclear transport factor 2 family protein [Paraburkholderia sp. UCT31]